MDARLTRRRLLGSAAAACATLLAGCRTFEPPGPPCDPPGVSGIDWIPDVVHPVGWGEEHLTTADGAPRTLSIYYPSPRFIPPRPMLRSCIGRWPLVLFLHGQPPSGLSPTVAQAYNLAWWRVPVALARSGYVVVVPRYTAVLPQATHAGGHFEYLETNASGNAPRSNCSLIAGVAADLVALFVAANVQSLTRVLDDLRKPTVTLTDAQQTLAIQHLTSIDRIEVDRDCRVDLKWRVGGVEGSRRLGGA